MTNKMPKRRQFRLHRRVRLVRGEESDVEVRLVPKERLVEMAADEKAAIEAEAEAHLNSGRRGGGQLGLYVTPDGDLRLAGYWAQFFEAEWSGDGRWEYDGGEVSVEGLAYGPVVEPA